MTADPKPRKAASSAAKSSASPHAKKTSSARTPSFDRIKPVPAATPRSGPVVDANVADVQGKRALFSGANQPPSVGSVAIECGNCGRRSVVSYVRLARLWTRVSNPALSLGTNQRAWVKCPACKQRGWVTPHPQLTTTEGHSLHQVSWWRCWLLHQVNWWRCCLLHQVNWWRCPLPVGRSRSRCPYRRHQRTDGVGFACASACPIPRSLGRCP